MGSKERGYIMLYRNITDHWLWEDKPFSYGQAWIDLLLLANHTDAKVLLGRDVIEVKRGSRVTSIRQLGARWGWSNSKVTRFLRTCEKEEMIKRECDTRKTVVTIENYGSYQAVKKAGGTRAEHDKNTSEPPTHTNNNDKNEKNEKERNIDKSVFRYGEFSNVVLSDKEFEKLREEYQDYRARIEKLSLYKASTGKVYKNDYATIKTWARKDDTEKPAIERMRKEL
jgi:hypothetical protein